MIVTFDATWQNWETKHCHQHGYEKKFNMCIFMSTMLILIQIKFDIDINNDKLLETIQEHKEKKNWWPLTMHSNGEPKYIAKSVCKKIVLCRPLPCHTFALGWIFQSNDTKTQGWWWYDKCSCCPLEEGLHKALSMRESLVQNGN